ncbi:putative membrane protein [Acinetobacter baumannii 58452]|nr:putative membrane protein [Acinetobacter baumannii 58452]
MYAFFAAKGIQVLPFTKIILSLVAAVFLIRGFAFPWLKSKFVCNSDLFWYVSSAFCLILGALYAAGVYLI